MTSSSTASATTPNPGRAPLPPGFAHRFFERDSDGATRPVTLHAVVGGGGPLVVLLHGFPEFWLSWRQVMRPLAEAGYTVCALDLRGHGASTVSDRVADYAADVLADDVAHVVRALGFERAHVVGHDWGGAVAWHIARRGDACLDKLVVLNAPHPELFQRALFQPEQLRASSYMFLFQLPWLAERKVRADDLRPLRNIYKHQPRRKGAFTDDDIEAYVEAYRRDGAVFAGLATYRAAFRQAAREAVFGRSRQRNGQRDGQQRRLRVIERPTLVLWGMNDTALLPLNLEGLERKVASLKIVRLEDCSHWVQHDQPERVVDEVVRFLSA